MNAIWEAIVRRAESAETIKLVEHILVSDKAYADYYAKRQDKGAGLGGFFTRFFRWFFGHG